MKLAKIISIVLALSGITAPTFATEQIPNGVSANDIYFYPLPEKYGQKISTKYIKPVIQYNNFNLTVYRAPSNGSWSGIGNQHNVDNGFMLTAYVNRHGTTEVADWFNNSQGESGANINPENNSTFGHTADKLNFAFRGDLTFSSQINNQPAKNYLCKNVVIAQGHTASYNNWWFAGKNCQWLGKVNVGPFKHSSDSVMCMCQRVSNSSNAIPIPATVVFVRGTNGIAQSDHEVWVYTGPFIPQKAGKIIVH